MKKKMATILLALCLAGTMGACGNSSSASKEEASSQDDTKKFAYKDGKISYEVSMMGTTATVNHTQTSKDIPEYFKESASTIEDLDVGSAPLDKKYNAMREMSHTDVKPGATIQSVVAYKINYADQPVTLVASDGIIGDEIGTKIINLQ